MEPVSTGRRIAEGAGNWRVYGAAFLDAIEDARGQAFAIASSGGLGRRTPEEATTILDLTVQLVVH